MSGLTLGHILLAAALLEALTAAFLLMAASKNRANGPGTPGYARARDSRRIGLWLLAGAAVMAIVALTPIGNIALGGGGA